MFSNFLKVLGIQGEQQQPGTPPTNKPSTTSKPATFSPATKSVAAQLNEDEEEELPTPGPQKELKTYKGEVQEDDLFVESNPDAITASPSSSTNKRAPASTSKRQPDLFKDDKEDEESWLFLESQKERLSVIYARPEGAEAGMSTSLFPAFLSSLMLTSRIISSFS